jgi:hypothetical protein
MDWPGRGADRSVLDVDDEQSRLAAEARATAEARSLINLLFV